MNILGHFYFSQNSKQRILSAFIYKTIQKKNFLVDESPLQKDFKFQYELEQFSLFNNHYQISRERFKKTSVKYSYLFTDLIYDHFFAKYWNGKLDLSGFDNYYKQIILGSMPLLPRKSQIVFAQFFSGFNLKEFDSLSGLHDYVLKINLYKSFPIHFMNSFEDFISEYEMFQKDFDAFLSDLTLFVLEREESCKEKMTL